MTKSYTASSSFGKDLFARPFVSSSSIFIRSEITRGSTTGWSKQATQSAAQPVRLSAASDSVAYCDITTVKPPDFVPDPHRASGCVTAPGLWPLQRPTIWLITNHRPIECKYPFLSKYVDRNSGFLHSATISLRRACMSAQFIHQTRCWNRSIQPGVLNDTLDMG